MSLIYNENINVFIWIALLLFIVFACPALVIHINYYVVNHGDVLEFSDQIKEITIHHKDGTRTFSLDDIDYVQRSMSWNKAAKRSFVAPWEGYNHSYIYLKDGTRFTITSLLVPDLDLPLEEGKVIVKQNFYRLAKTY